MDFSNYQCLAVQRQDSILHVTFNRANVRNALSLEMVRELTALFADISGDLKIRAVVLRGAGGHFCAGGDISDMAKARSQMGVGETDPFFLLNRAFGAMLESLEQAPQTVICVLEGAVMGGGFGLACISDLALAHRDARFALPETGLGIPPAQIAPFVVKRIGLTQARRLALTGMKLNGEQACSMGIAHEVFATTEALDEALGETLQQVMNCAPIASAVTKQLMLSVGQKPMNELLDEGAREFSDAIRSPEGMEGASAFLRSAGQTGQS